MTLKRPVPILVVAAFVLFLPAGAAAGQATQGDSPAGQLPAELRGAKIYRLPDKSHPKQSKENLASYRGLFYQSIDLERLVLNLYASLRPVDRAATVRRIYFQDVRANGVPLHIETFNKEFKLSKKEAVALPAPLRCTLVFSELESLQPVKEIVNQDKLRVTGQTFIEVKLNLLEKLAMHAKQVVIPINLSEEIPLNMFSGNPLMQMAGNKILDTLTDPSSAAALALAKEHLAKLTENRTLAAAGQPALYLLYCEYGLVDPQTKAVEKLSQSGTGFVVSSDGKLLTAKRVVQPWKFDPQVAFLMARRHLQLDPGLYKLCAWPVGTSVLSKERELDLQSALRTDNQTLKLLKTAPDSPMSQEYQDPDSGERTTLSLEGAGENDLAVLQLSGAEFKPLPFADVTAKSGPGIKVALFGFPFGLNQPQASPQLLFTKAATGGSLLTLEHQLDPGESGAPLLTPEGKVLALASSENQCILIEKARALIP